jgi:4-hydroxythreonine-4-phosphate dehydrogenase
MNIILSVGDCNGIGPETGLKALLDTELVIQHNFMLCIHPETLTDILDSLEIQGTIRDNHLLLDKERVIKIIPCATKARLQYGKPALDAALMAIESLNQSIEYCILHKADAMVTLPVSKACLKMAGWQYPGQTEMIAAGSVINKHPLMILFHESFRMALATIHVPLAQVSGLLDQDTIIFALKTLYKTLVSDWAIAQPRIAVLALNPHAGEEGHIGMEEITTIIPAIQKAQMSGIPCQGPFPADAFFAQAREEHFDAVLAMYHDQGLIPLKMKARGMGVNFTAGLDIVRTSPDHGTAYDIAGQGIASHQSTLQAIIQAIHIADNRRKYNEL